MVCTFKTAVLAGQHSLINYLCEISPLGITALLSETGDIVGSYYYDVWGNTLEKNESEAITNPYRYAGYQYDEETDLYYLNARYYDAKIARFLTEDSVTGDCKDPLSLNRYSYCHNNPIAYTDPTGNVAAMSYMADGGRNDKKTATTKPQAVTSKGNKNVTITNDSTQNKKDKAKKEQIKKDIKDIEVSKAKNKSGGAKIEANKNAVKAQNNGLNALKTSKQDEKNSNDVKKTKPNNAINKSASNGTSQLGNIVDYEALQTELELAFAGLSPTEKSAYFKACNDYYIKSSEIAVQKTIDEIPSIVRESNLTKERDMQKYQLQAAVMTIGASTVIGLTTMYNETIVTSVYDNIGDDVFKSFTNNVDDTIEGGTASKPLYRVMGEGELKAVQETGKLRGGREGTTYFTDSYFKNANNAKSKLALPEKPKYIMEFEITNNPSINGGTRVTPAFYELGGAREYFADDIINVEIINFQKMIP